MYTNLGHTKRGEARQEPILIRELLGNFSGASSRRGQQPVANSVPNTQPQVFQRSAATVTGKNRDSCDLPSLSGRHFRCFDKYRLMNVLPPS